MEPKQPTFTFAQKLSFFFGLIATIATGYILYIAFAYNFQDWDLFITTIDFILSTALSVISIIATIIAARYAKNNLPSTPSIKNTNTVTIINQNSPMPTPEPEPEPAPYKPPRPEVFWKRVKNLHELKSFNQYREFGELDEEGCITGRHYTDNGTYLVIIRCDDRRVNVTGEDINNFLKHSQGIIRYHKQQNAKLKPKLIYVVPSDVEILETTHISAGLKRSQIDFELKTEDKLLDEFIRFEPYLRRLCDRYHIDKLPYSNLPLEKQKTLSDVYIQPRFTIKDRDYSGSLDSYIDSWLVESSPRHLALLADYGIGKSSYVKHLAARLAKKWLFGNRSGRIPILIELGTESPRTDTRAKGILSKFNDDNSLGSSAEALRYLMRAGRVLLLLDGFDEMDLIGDHDQRRQHFETLWTLAEHNNKIIISGRPGYFPNEAELKRTLDIADHRTKGGTGARYCTRINLDPFKEDDIKSAFKNYFRSDWQTQYQSIASQPQLLTIAERAALLHIILDTLANKRSTSSPFYRTNDSNLVKPAHLLRTYTEHWMTRELEKNRTLLIKDTDRRRFSMELATHLYINDKVEITATDLYRLYARWFSKDTKNRESLQIIEGIKTDLRTCTFMVPTGDSTFKFAHMPFLEYFVAVNITRYLIRNKQLPPSLRKLEWRHEICRHVADLLLERKLNAGEIANKLDYSEPQKELSFWQKLFENQRFRTSLSASMQYNSTQIEIYAGSNFSKTHIGNRFSKSHRYNLNPRKTSIRHRHSDPDKIDLSSLISQLDMRGVNLQEVNLRGAKLQKADLRGAKLQKADLRGAKLQETKFDRANLSEADLQKANLQKANLKEANLRGTNLQGTNLTKATLRDAILQRARLQGVNLQGAYLQGAYLQDALLQKADLRGAYLHDAYLRGAYLQDALLQNADLQNADLQEANLQRANLQGANLQGVNLKGVNLIGASLIDANLKGAKVSETQLRENGVILNPNTILPNGKKWKLSNRNINL